MKDHLISILVPFRNTEPFLEELIDSVKRQNYEHWEMILIDDHSTDDGAQLVSIATEIDKRIKLYKATGKGIIEALRQAFSISKGDFITRMDSDDLMLPLKLDHMMRQLVHYGRRHIALGKVQYFSESQLGNGYMAYEKWLNNLTETGTNFNDIYKECSIPSPCWMLYREDLEACGAFNSTEYPEDYDLAFRMYQQGYTCIPANNILHKWRDYAHRTSRTSPNYADNRFLNMKLTYFLRIDFSKEASLVLWGAGKKGKEIAKYLISESIPFIWISNNPNKLGHNIYGVFLKDYKELEHINKAQIIIAVANKESQTSIKTYLNSFNSKSDFKAFFFC